MSSQQSLNKFFTDKTLVVPQYQRSYAWEKQNVRELYEDINEAFETESSHYVGTVVLSKTQEKGVYSIVDGQQRLTTIMMFINAIINSLEDPSDRAYYTRLYVKSKSGYKLTPLERDADFFHSMLDSHENTCEPCSKSQRFLVDAYSEIKTIVDQLIPKPEGFLEAIEGLDVLEFIEDQESDAIRIFQTVNDRGKELSRMDKMKSLLFYFSNKYLAGEHDDLINNVFGELFELYDDIKMIAEDQNIRTISSALFTEDDILRQHHVCFSDESFDPTAQEVLENVKKSLLQMRKENNVEEMSTFVVNFSDSLLEYTRAFKKVVSKVEDDEKYYKLFSILGLSAVYYPVITQLERADFLGQVLPSKGITVIDMIEIIDVRVFKVRDYAGRKHVGDFAYSLNNEEWTLEEVEEDLLWFNSFEISDNLFKEYLSNKSYYKQTGLLRLIFLDLCERLTGKKYSLNELQKIMSKNPTIEHILSQNPKFKTKPLGFKDDEDFETHEHLVGNLTLLEKSLNSSIQNNGLPEKVKGYSKSQFIITQQLGTTLSQTNSFRKSDLKQRMLSLVEDFSRRWWAE